MFFISRFVHGSVRVFSAASPGMRNRKYALRGATRYIRTDELCGARSSLLTKYMARWFEAYTHSFNLRQRLERVAKPAHHTWYEWY